MNTVNSQKDDQFSGSEFARKLAKAKNGSIDQQAELLESFRDYMRQLAAKTIGSDNANGQLSASDLVQSAIIDACKGFERCRAASEEEFKAWLRQIIMNDILDRYRFLRSQKRDVGLEQELEPERLLAPEDASPVAEAQRKEDELRLVTAMSTLCEDHQKIIRLRHQDKQTFVQIGEAMDKTPNAVRMLWNRAVEELSKKL